MEGSRIEQFAIRLEAPDPRYAYNTDRICGMVFRDKDRICHFLPCRKRWSGRGGASPDGKAECHRQGMFAKEAFCEEAGLYDTKIRSGEWKLIEISLEVGFGNGNVSPFPEDTVITRADFFTANNEEVSVSEEELSDVTVRTFPDLSVYAGRKGYPYVKEDGDENKQDEENLKGAKQ